MKKVLLASALVSTMILSPTAIYASSEDTNASVESEVSSVIPPVEVNSIDEIFTNDFFNGLPKIEDAEMDIYRQIEKYKEQNPHLSDEEVYQHFEKTINQRGPSLQASGYNEAKATWNTLTAAEKKLVVSDPTNAALTKLARDLAYDYTVKNYGKSGAGDTSDAFRHAVWNALMCKYISEPWATKMANAHEEKGAAYMKEIQIDGYTGAQHTKMDLHNNQKGRDCWSFTDTITIPSDGTLQNRVIAKIKAGEMMTLHN